MFPGKHPVIQANIAQMHGVFKNFLSVNALSVSKHSCFFVNLFEKNKKRIILLKCLFNNFTEIYHGS